MKLSPGHSSFRAESKLKQSISLCIYIYIYTPTSRSKGNFPSFFFFYISCVYKRSLEGHSPKEEGKKHIVIRLISMFVFFFSPFRYFHFFSSLLIVVL